MIVPPAVDIYLFVLFSIAFIAQLWYYLGNFRVLAFYKKNDGAKYSPPASIVICSKNELQNLKENLPSILTQNYPDYEVVVVNDCSFDGTDELLKQFSKQYEHLKIVTIKEDEHYQHGKKFAQMVGIKGTKHEHLLFTDADCKPMSNEWLKIMVSNFDNNTDIILGYGSYEKTKGWLNKLIRFDTFYIALQYLSFALINKPYMGVGRNLAYKKSLFFKHKGFASHYHIDSGNDDLFVNEAATKTNCKIEIDPAAQTISKPKKSYSNWIKQKRRHITTGSHYNNSTKMQLGLLTFNQYLFFMLFAALVIINTKFIIYAVSIFVLRYFVQMLIFNKAMQKLGEKNLLFLAPLLELELLLFYPVFLFANLFARKKNKWKS